jgi:hypothetical protein
LIVGITGHRVLPDPALWGWVKQELTQFLCRLDPPLVGITSLAIGADQLFAKIILELGGKIIAIIPFADYERTFEDEADLRNYLSLKAAAIRVETLGPFTSDNDAYGQAGKRVTDLCELLIAVWDGEPAQGPGGTGDIVKYAISRQKPFVQFNPLTREILFQREPV